MKILGRNYRCPAGEIDLIALDPTTRRESGAETIVFVEVKTRRSDDFTDPDAAVNAAKQRRIRSAAKQYISHHPTSGYNVRFDIVSIVWPEGGKPKAKHIEDAF